MNRDALTERLIHLFGAEFSGPHTLSAADDLGDIHFHLTRDGTEVIDERGPLRRVLCAGLTQTVQATLNPCPGLGSEITGTLITPFGRMDWAWSVLYRYAGESRGMRLQLDTRAPVQGWHHVRLFASGEGVSAAYQREAGQWISEPPPGIRRQAAEVSQAAFLTLHSPQSEARTRLQDARVHLTAAQTELARTRLACQEAARALDDHDALKSALF